LDENEKVIGLNLAGIKLDPVPEALSTFQHLQKLILHSTQLKDISFLQGLSSLTYLYLWNNQITDISFLQELSHLTVLNLGGNQITDISFLQGLRHLTQLSLRDNKIKELPEALMKLGLEINVESEGVWKQTMYLDGNPLEKPPIEIIEKGKAAIYAYFKSLKGKTLPLNEVKVLLVGDGGAGKTSLVKRLLDKRFDEKEPQTHGINIKQWEVKQGKTIIKTHLWDFGGQEIMHATHQFFLSKRSLYILVLDCRKDEKTEYWLKHIQSFGGDSPVLVVLNKIDENPGFEVNRLFLQEKYKNIKGFFRLSCAKNTGIKEFADALTETLSSVEMLRTTWAESWFQIKKRLETMTEPFITYEKYTGMCIAEKISDKTSQDTLVDFLNDLGVILHFNDLDLQGVHVLEPKWVTEAVYKIINSEKLAQCKGILELELLNEILKRTGKNDYDYPPDKHPYIIRLMNKFELCYEIDKQKVLVPDLLDVQQSSFDFDYADSLKFLFEYDFLPRSIMPRFIVRMHNDIKNELRWRTGVVLENKAFHATAVVKADNEEKKIYIYVSGTQKRDYFAVIRHTIRDINGSFEKLNAVEKVPLPDNETIAIDYAELIGYEEVGEEKYLVGKLKKRYSIKKLLNGIEAEETRRPPQATQLRSMIVGGDVTIFDMKGDGASVTIHNTIEVEKKLEIIIKELREHDVPGKEELIKELQDGEVKKDKSRLRKVLGTVLTRAAEIASLGSAVTSLLSIL
ncbi:MAG: internalin, partial [Acidobacteriota bacterium]|nr:internalin [Acidobacteriota bacterium]